MATEIFAIETEKINVFRSFTHKQMAATDTHDCEQMAISGYEKSVVSHPELSELTDAKKEFPCNDGNYFDEFKNGNILILHNCTLKPMFLSYDEFANLQL